MALGKIQSINPDNISGTVLEDETEQVYDFSDPNFPNTGLKLGDLCTYDIDYSSRIPVASNLNVYTPTETEITTVVNGPITVNTGETLKIKNGGNVKGNINVGQANRLIIGDDTGGGIVKGSITVNKIRKVSITNTSTINCG